jgi:hypothetical protein
VGVVENQNINQTARVEGELSTFSFNEQLRKISEWWSKLKAAVTIPQGGGGIFTAGEGSETEPSVTFFGLRAYGLYFDNETGRLAIAYGGKPYGEVQTDRFAAYVKPTAGQSIPNTTWTVVTFATSNFNDGGLWDSTVSTSRLYAPVDGIYQVNANVTYAQLPSANSRVIVRIRKNSTIIAAGDEIFWNTGIYAGLLTSQILWLDAGDYVDCNTYHNSGSARSLNASRTNFQAKRVG